MQLDEYGAPAHLEAGVRCGSHGKGRRVYHESAEAVRVCYQVMRYEVSQQMAELAAERDVERYFEDRGYEEARAQDDYEARNGVIPFDVAMRNALDGRS